MNTRAPKSIDVWRSYHCETDYSISLSDDDGEISCLGGEDDKDEAFEVACEFADQYGVPARILIGETDQVEREYTPEDGS